MSEQKHNKPGQQENESLDTLQDIRRMMDRSSRFISLSGLSGVAAGICALVGAGYAYHLVSELGPGDITERDFSALKIKLIVLAVAVLAAAWVSALFFTWRRAKKNQLPVWDLTSKRMVTNLLVPLVAGGFFILAMLQNNHWQYVVPACLVFYGLALVNAGKYTITDIRYLGYCEIILGLLCTQFIGYGLYFWAAGFGLLHIVYGFIVWWKNEK
jgi:hypothetical protein